MTLSTSTSLDIDKARAAVTDVLTYLELYVQNGGRFKSPAESAAADARVSTALALVVALYNS